MKAYFPGLVLMTLVLLSGNVALAQTYNAADLLMPVRSFYYPTNSWKPDSLNIEFLNTTFIAAIQTLPDSNYQIRLEGHTDDVGNLKSNLLLSEKRVRFVYDVLIRHGIPPHRITISWFGSTKPEQRKIAISNRRNDIRYANRRVVLVVQKKSAVAP